MDYLSGWCQSQRRLDGCTAIITGANGGIGKETTLDLYKRGARVIMACRNLDRAESAKRDIIKEARNDPNNGTLVVEMLDLCSLTSVREFATRFLTSEKHLQILVNNAGVMCCPEGKTEDGFETHIGSNHLGHALLTLLLLPRLKESAPARVIFVSSAIHYFHQIDLDDLNYLHTRYHSLEAYSKSKTANVMFAKALALKLQKNNIKGVTTYSVHPGIVYTDIVRHVWSLVSRCFRLKILRWMWKSPKCGAQSTIYCAVDEDCAEQSGLYYSDCVPCPPSSYCQDDRNVLKLWDVTIKMLGLHDYQY